jgi:hypothetical protein
MNNYYCHCKLSLDIGHTVKTTIKYTQKSTNSQIINEQKVFYRFLYEHCKSLYLEMGFRF